MALVLREKCFDFRTKELGVLRISVYNLRASESFSPQLSDIDKKSATVLVRKLITIVGKRYKGSDGRETFAKITATQARLLTDPELEKFSKKFIEKNDWLFKDYDNPKLKTGESDSGVSSKTVRYSKRVIPKERNETYSHHLIRIIQQYENAFRERMARLFSSFRFRTSVIDEIRRSSALDVRTLFGGMRTFHQTYWEISGLQSTAAELARMSKLPSLSIAMSANDSIAQLRNSVGQVKDILQTSSVISNAWREQFSSIRDFLGTNKLFAEQLRSTLSDISRISLVAQSSVAQLRKETLGDIFNLQNEVKSIIYHNAQDFWKSYSNLFKSFQGSAETLLSFPPTVSKLPPIEFFIDAELLRMISTRQKKSDTFVDKRDELKQEIFIETDESFLTDIMVLNNDLLNLYNGAKQALKSDNPDRVRHFTISLRELFTQVLHLLAPDDEIKDWDDSPQNFDDHNRPTRKARLKFICREINHGPLLDFIKADIKAVLEFLNLFQRGTHQVVSSFTEEQLNALLVRLEGTLRFLIEIKQSNE